MSSPGNQPNGWFEPSDGANEYNSIAFVFRQLLGQARTAAIVQVQSVNPMGTGGFGMPVGTVGIKILVKLMDSLGNTFPHGTIQNVPYFRLQGGSNAVIMDPAVNDIGLAIICDRDSSVVLNTTAEAPPGSFRRNDLADGMYFGGFLNGAPTQFLQFTSTGINLSDMIGNEIVTNSSGISINGVVFRRGLSGDYWNHTHSGVQTGSGNSGVVNSGT
jgi:hypothetical protein